MMMLVVLVALLTQLWVSCFLARTYSELLQDAANDADDKALVNFVWERRRETWVQARAPPPRHHCGARIVRERPRARAQLRRFEDVVQRQFEELRSSLVNRQGVRGTPS